MPRFSRKSKRRTGDDEFIVKHLHGGICLACMVDHELHTTDSVRLVWEKLRDTVLPAFIQENPGQRPWAWWEFDAPGRRERIDGGLHPFDNKARTLHVASVDNPNFWKVAYRLTFGLPSAFIPPYDSGLKTEMFEPEWSFLVRHNLLLPQDSP